MGSPPRPGPRPGQTLDRDSQWSRPQAPGLEEKGGPSVRDPWEQGVGQPAPAASTATLPASGPPDPTSAFMSRNDPGCQDAGLFNKDSAGVRLKH